jgi:hypothetical protein
MSCGCCIERALDSAKTNARFKAVPRRWFAFSFASSTCGAETENWRPAFSKMVFRILLVEARMRDMVAGFDGLGVKCG